MTVTAGSRLIPALCGTILLAGCGDAEVALSPGPPRPTAEQIAAVRAKYSPSVEPDAAPILPLTMFRDWDMQQVAADTLARIGEPAIPELVRLLEHTDPKTRARAAWALGRMGPKAKPAVPALMTALRDGDRLVQESAARALGQIGPDAAEAIPELVRVLSLPSEAPTVVPAPLRRPNWAPP